MEDYGDDDDDDNPFIFPEFTLGSIANTVGNA